MKTHKPLAVIALSLAMLSGTCLAQSSTTYTTNKSSFPTIRPSTRGDCDPTGNAACVIEVRVTGTCADPQADLVPKPDFLYLKKKGARQFVWRVMDSPGWEFAEKEGIKVYQDPDGQVASSLRLAEPKEWLLVHKAAKNHYPLGYQITLVNGPKKCVLDPGLITDWP
jgi:hypothetical protein